MQASEPLIVDVIVQTWPESTGIIVRTSERLIGEYEIPEIHEAGELGLRRDDPLFDMRASFEARRDAAVAALQDNQDYLQACFGVERPVSLRVDEGHRRRVVGVLSEFGIGIDQVRIDRLPEFEWRLQEMPLEQLFELLCRWHDVVELRSEPGTSASDPGSWVARAKPGDCHLFHHLSTGAERRHEHGSPQEEEAYRLFLDLADPKLADFTLGSLLRWHYYHRAEFPDRELPRMRALEQAQEMIQIK